MYVVWEVLVYFVVYVLWFDGYVVEVGVMQYCVFVFLYVGVLVFVVWQFVGGFQFVGYFNKFFQCSFGV